MTIRMFLVSRFRKLMCAGILAWLGCAAAGFSASARLIPEWATFIPFAGFFVVVLLMCYGFGTLDAAVLSAKMPGF